MMVIRVLLVILVMVTCCHGADILYISGTPSPSHHIWDKTLAMALRDRQHQITFVTHSDEKSAENFTTIILEGIYDKIHEEFDYEDLAHSTDINSLGLMYDWLEMICVEDLKTKGVQQLMELAKKGAKFDLVIFDVTAAHCLYPFIELFGSPPTIATSQFGLQGYHTFFFGTDIYTAYNPLYLLPYSDQMTFFQRMYNYVLCMYNLYLREYVYMPAIWKKSEEFFGKDIIPYQTVEKTFSLMLTNYDPNLDYPVPIPPAIIPVGGLHTKREKSLPKDIQQIMDDAKHGVILFSLGTNMRSDMIGIKQRQALIDAFSKLKQTVLWKFESEIKNLPPNVIVRKWLPQNDILAHPNTRLFITHGGALSTQEAMYHGVPVVGIPFFADQHVNMHKMLIRGLGLKLVYAELNTADILHAVNQILDNTGYKERASIISRRYRDQPQDPLSRAIFWVEYTIRQGGAGHLRIASRDMPAYQLLLLDVWAAWITALLAIYLAIRYTCTCFTKKTHKQKKN